MAHAKIFRFIECSRKKNNTATTGTCHATQRAQTPPLASTFNSRIMQSMSSFSSAVKATRRLRCLRIFAIAAAVLAFGTGEALGEPPCGDDTPLDASCEIALEALHPTQPAVGMMQVEERAARMKSGIDGVRYTRERPIPVVQGPDGSFYLTDSHHLVSVLSRVGVKRATARLIGRIREPADFWPKMQARHWVYLFDARGRRIAPSALPKHIADLVDDPYRALAGYAESAGYFHRTDAYFMEFEWARYFGSHMRWQPINRMNLLSALESAAKLACRPEANSLPGYAGPCRP
jgi:hypothetical protein